MNSFSVKKKKKKKKKSRNSGHGNEISDTYATS